MLNARDIILNQEAVEENLKRRNASEVAMTDVHNVVTHEANRVACITQIDELRASKNSLSRTFGRLMADKASSSELEPLRRQAEDYEDRISRLMADKETAEKLCDEALTQIPNLLHSTVPAGHDESSNKVLAEWGRIPRFDFEPLGHEVIGERLGILDATRAAKLSGSRFSVLKGAGARLERALIQWFLDVHTSEHGYTEVMVPYIVNQASMQGTGQLPKFKEDMFKLEGELNGSGAYLIPTAEVPVTNLHRDEILEEVQLPIKYCAFTPCFRSEAGSAGKDGKGLIRLHQFHKVELVWLTTPEQADAAHETLTQHAESLLRLLELPYRRMLLCAGDTSFNASKCYDLEVWFPSQSKYREISSCSQFGDYQSRNMQIRYRPAIEGKKAKTRLVHTLNGSALAVGRTVAAILENFQQEDGSVPVPSVLHKYMGNVTVIR